MRNYILQQDEIVLYQGDCYIKSRNEINDDLIPFIANTTLILTNKNIVFTTKTDRNQKDIPVEVELFSIGDIKIYNELPQIKQNDSHVEIFFINGEKTFDMLSRSEARKFINEAVELITGKTMANRVSAKIKGAVGIVDDAIGIKTVDTIKSVAENGIFGMAFGNLGKKLFNNKASDEKEASANPPIESASPSNSIDDQIEALKKLKELLDVDIITQEDFDFKKKQILGI